MIYGGYALLGDYDNLSNLLQASLHKLSSQIPVLC